jgi:hypothetical protein
VSTRNRSQDLTADLLHDLAAEDTAPAVAPPPGITAPAAHETRAAPSPFVETSLFLAPRAWLRPRVAVSGATVSVSAGPIRLRVGRR